MIKILQKSIVICETRVSWSGFILFAENRMRWETEELQTLCWPEIGGTSVGEEVEWGERTSRDKTGKEGMISTLRWCASARTAYSSFMLSSSCHHRRHQGRWYARHLQLRYRKFVSRSISWATSRLVASPISRMVIITRRIKWCERQRAVIEILFSSRHNFCRNYQQFQRERYHALPNQKCQFAVKDLRAESRVICSHIDKIDLQNLRYIYRIYRFSGTTDATESRSVYQSYKSYYGAFFGTCLKRLGES